MKKQVKDFEINFDFDWDGITSIEQIEKDLAALKEKGATHINIQHYSHFGDSDAEYYGCCKRIETDEEFQERIKIEKREQEEIRQRELKRLNELKQKYEQ